MAKHNKKRNVGLIHEQLVRHASEKIVEGKKEGAEQIMKILNEHFEEGTSLYREFRLFNALVHTNVQDRVIARRIIEESKTACKNHNDNQLRAEKSKLIKAINHQIDCNGFYSRRIPEYKVFATVQTLLNEWRGANRLSPVERVEYEELLETWLVRESNELSLEKKPDADPLALKIMMQKFNKKYAALNKEQIQLLEFKLMGDNDALINQIDHIKQKAELALKEFYHTCNNKILLEKREDIERRIRSVKPATSDKTITQALMLSALIYEMEDNNE